MIILILGDGTMENWPIVVLNDNEVNIGGANFIRDSR